MVELLLLSDHIHRHGGVTHVVYSRGSAGSGNKHYWAPTPKHILLQMDQGLFDIVMTGGGGAGGTSGGGAGGVVHYANKDVTTW